MEAPPCDLNRFLEAQERIYASVVSELGAGRKRTHWMWFIFPQIDGLGTSETARRYAIKHLEEARAYLFHPVLGPRLLECTRLVNAIKGRTAREILGIPDDMKFRSSMTLFELVAGQPSDFTEALEKYFAGERDEATLRLVGASAP